jgi:serine/threonine protein kinase
VQRLHSLIKTGTDKLMRVATGGLIKQHPQIRGLSEWSPLARGGLAVVWQARQVSLGRLVAVKVYQGELDQGDRRRFLREAAAAGRLSNHAGIVTSHDAGILPDGRPYLIMELYPGGSLTEWLKSENRPSEERVRQVGVLMADALAAAHACGVLHRDVKPANILIDSYGNPALADFGLATIAGAETTSGDALRLTPAYSPPEAFAMQATESGDVFSLAATLYALLAGSPPRGLGVAPVALEQMVESVKRPIGQLPGVNWYLMEVLMTALSNDPAARPTAARFRDQLANVPAPGISRRGLFAGAAEDTSSGIPGERSVVQSNSTVSNDDRVAVMAVTADSQRAPGQLASAKASRPRGNRREAILALAAAVVTVIGFATAWIVNEPPSSGVSAGITQGATPGGLPSNAAASPALDETGSGSAQVAAISVEGPAGSARPFQTVRIQGTYRGGADTLLRVERWEAGKWVAFPLPAKTDKLGQFTAYVELGEPGRYRLRVLDPDAHVTSKPSDLVIKG